MTPRERIEQAIRERVLEPYGVSIGFLRQKGKCLDAAPLRWLIVEILVVEFEWSINRAAAYMNRDHTSMCHGLKMLKARRAAGEMLFTGLKHQQMRESSFVCKPIPNTSLARNPHHA